MTSWLRVVVTWLLALALPAQGLAAATMALCAPAAIVAAHAVTGAAPAAPHCDEHAAVAPDPSRSKPAPGEGGVVAKCSICAACAALAALPGAVLHVPEPAPVATRFAADVPAVEHFVADGPERPPRAAPVPTA